MEEIRSSAENIKEDIQRPVRGVNTSYEMLTGLVEKYMREHTAVNEICDEG